MNSIPPSSGPQEETIPELDYHPTLDSLTTGLDNPQADFIGQYNHALLDQAIEKFNAGPICKRLSDILNNTTPPETEAI